MKKLNGVPVSQGKAIGEAYILTLDNLNHERVSIKANNIQIEKQKFQDSLSKTKENLDALLEIARTQEQQEQIEILETYHVMLMDPILISEIEQYIEKELVTVESASTYVFDSYVQKMLAIDDPYFQARADDFKQILRMILTVLKGEQNAAVTPTHNFILIAKEIGPADISNIDKTYLKGFILESGNKTSHAAIVARALGIPMVSGITNIESGFTNCTLCAIDGTEGIIYLEPNEEIQNDFSLAIEQKAEQDNLEKNLLLEPAITLDGTKVNLLANIGTPEEIESVLENNADGIGLFRTELLFMAQGGTQLPSEDEQFETYKQVLVKMNGKPVTFRTLDIGGDKQLPALEIPKEENPYLGWRAIRYCLTKQDVFRTQIRALLRASVFGNAKIMLPMIISKEEIIETKKIIQEESAKLAEQNIECSIPPVGIMIETPAAAVNAEELATVSDFFSIGSNDLTQYTLAVDRGNTLIADLYNEAHPAVLKLIQQTISSAKNAGIPISLCGEMAGNPEFADFLLNAGLTDFSMSPILLLKIKKLVRNYSSK